MSRFTTAVELGETFDLNAHVGELLAIRVLGRVKVYTAYGENAIHANVAVIAADGTAALAENVVILPKTMVSLLSNSVGAVVLGVLSRREFANGEGWTMTVPSKDAIALADKAVPSEF
jgi:hypothetical protein